MIERVVGTYEGQSALIVNVGIGFIPNKVQIFGLDDVMEANWTDLMSIDQTTDQSAGWIADAGTPTVTALAAGISIYRGGGAPLAASSGANVIKNASPDYRTSITYGTITSWTLGNATNRTGNFDIAVDSTYVTVGSFVVIDGKRYFITVSDGTGTSANSITLSESVSSGRVDFIARKFDYTAAPVGTIMPAGFSIAADTELNTTTEANMFIADHHEVR